MQGTSDNKNSIPKTVKNHSPVKNLALPLNQTKPLLDDLLTNLCNVSDGWTGYGAMLTWTYMFYDIIIIYDNIKQQISPFSTWCFLPNTPRPSSNSPASLSLRIKITIYPTFYQTRSMYVSWCLSVCLLYRGFWDLISVTLVDEDTNWILADDVNIIALKAISGNVTMQVVPPS